MIGELEAGATMKKISTSGLNGEGGPGAEKLLRHQADKILGARVCREPSHLEGSMPPATRYTEHELQVHQIELELQFQALQQLQRALIDSHARYFDLYNQAPVGYCTLSKNGMILEANLCAAKLLGVSQSELVGKTLSSFVFDDDSDACLLDQKLIEDSEAQACEMQILRSDGTQFWAHLDINAAQGVGGERCHRLVISDIGERIKAEKALLISEGRLAERELKKNKKFRQAILDSVSAQIAVLDRSGVIVAINAAWQRFAVENGLSPEQAARHTGVGVNYLDICQPDSSYLEASALTAREGIQRVLDGRLPSFVLEYACHSPRRQRWFIMSVTTLGGKNSGAVVTHTNITDSKEKLRALAAHQEQLLERERKHIAMEVHDEMGQLLTVLGLNTSLIGLRFGNDPELLGMIEEMHSHVDSATKVVRRIASNLRPAALDLGLLPALEWLAEDFSRRWKIGCKLDGSKVKIVLDDLHSTAVFRVVQESLTNVARHANAQAVVIALHQNKQQLRVIVKDNGRGFDATAVSNGAGFGLFGMRERLLALGGTLQIESAPGMGTAVTIELPRDLK